MNMFERKRKLSDKEILILQLLTSKGEMSGTDLINNSNGKLKRGLVYVALGKMADKGYVASRSIPTNDGSGMPKRLFRATEQGTQVYENRTIEKLCVLCGKTREHCNCNTLDPNYWSETHK